MRNKFLVFKIVVQRVNLTGNMKTEPKSFKRSVGQLDAVVIFCRGVSCDFGVEESVGVQAQTRLIPSFAALRAMEQLQQKTVR
jgi:hypothetical protein